jgi:hypothetical protein
MDDRLGVVVFLMSRGDPGAAPFAGDLFESREPQLSGRA